MTAFIMLAPELSTMGIPRDTFAPLAAALKDLSEGPQIAIGTLAVYVLGDVATSLGQRGSRVAQPALGWMARRVGMLGSKLGMRQPKVWRLEAMTLHDPAGRDSRVRGPVLDAAMADLVDVGAPSMSHLLMPQSVVFRLEDDVPLLRREAPELFAEYDKLRAESELRGALSLPLLALSLAASFRGGTAVWAVLGVLLALALVVRSRQLDTDALRVLATARLLGITRAEPFKIVLNALRPRSDLDDIETVAAVAALALEHSGYFDEAFDILDAVIHDEGADVTCFKNIIDAEPGGRRTSLSVNVLDRARRLSPST